MEAQTGGSTVRECCKWSRTVVVNQSVKIDQSSKGLEFLAAWCRCSSRSMYSRVGMETVTSSSGASSLPWQLSSSP